MSSSRRFVLLLAGWSVVLTLALYGDALSLPFFFDDYVHIPFVDEFSLAEMWRSAGELAYFRPLPFTIWKAMAALLGEHSQIWQHAVNLVAHALNGFLVGWLAGWLWAEPVGTGTTLRVRRSRAHALLAATLFLLYPLSYQAVPWVGSLAHLLVTSMLLLSLSAYWRWKRGDGHLWLGLGLSTALLAPFAHENGVLAAPLVALLALSMGSTQTRTDPQPGLPWRRAFRHAVLWALPVLIWAPVWALAPRGRSAGLALVGLEAMLQNSAYFLQGLAYPLTWPGQWLRQMSGLSDMVVVGILAGTGLGAAALIQRAGGGGRRAWLPWLWATLAALPAILFLSFDYVINGPRLLMLSSVGAAWLWTSVILRAERWLRLTTRTSTTRLRLGRVVLFALLLAVLIQNVLFVRQRMAMHQLLGDAYEEAVALALSAEAAGKPALFINFPSWLAPSQTSFALGHEGVQFWPDYAPPTSLTQVNAGLSAQVLLQRDDAIRPALADYQYGLKGQSTDWTALADEGGRVYLASYAPDKIALVPVGDLAPVVPERTPLARYPDPEGDQAIILRQADVRAPDGRLTVDLTWTVTGPIPDQVTVFVHVVNDQGRLLVQADGDPLGGALPFSRWHPGQTINERRHVGPVETTDFDLLVGVYNRLNGQRWPAVGPAGDSFADQAVPLQP